LFCTRGKAWNRNLLDTIIFYLRLFFDPWVAHYHLPFPCFCNEYAGASSETKHYLGSLKPQLVELTFAKKEIIYHQPFGVNLGNVKIIEFSSQPPAFTDFNKYVFEEIKLSL
jgi:hypothetical protein